jgi:hypothetical protein
MDSSLTVKTVLARINVQLVELRRRLAHDHRDTAFWSALDLDASRAQRARYYLRSVANLLHVDRATSRGRIHGTRFATLAEQQRWLASRESHALPVAGLPAKTTLAMLRAGAQ